MKNKGKKKEASRGEGTENQDKVYDSDAEAVDPREEEVVSREKEEEEEMISKEKKLENKKAKKKPKANEPEATPKVKPKVPTKDLPL